MITLPCAAVADLLAGLAAVNDEQSWVARLDRL